MINADDKVVLFDNTVKSETFNDNTIVTLLYNYVNPDIFNELNIVKELFNVENPETFIDDKHVVLPLIFDYYTLRFKAPFIFKFLIHVTLFKNLLYTH